MTTGNDYINDFIGMDEPDGTRSIVKLLEEEGTNGYSDMTDKEIAKLMEYKSNKAANSELVKAQIQDMENRSRMLGEHLREQQEFTNSVLLSLVNTPTQYVSVTGNEVE